MPTCRRAWRRVAARALPLQHRAMQGRPRSTSQQPKRRPAEFSPFGERPMETAHARYGTGKSSRLRSRFMVRMRLQPRISMSRTKTAKKHELQNDRRSTSPTTSARSLCLDSAQGQALRTPFDHRSASLTPPSRGFFCRRCMRRHVGGRSSRHLLMLVRCMRLIQRSGQTRSALLVAIPLVIIAFGHTLSNLLRRLLRQARPAQPRRIRGCA